MKSSESLERGFERAAQWSHRHHRVIAAAIVTLLLGTGVTAFGVAPMAPDAANLPKRLISEEVIPADWNSQVSAIDEFSFELTRNDLTRSSDTADTLLGRLNVTDAAAASFLRNNPTARRILQGRPGKMMKATAGELGELRELVVRFPTDDPAQAATHFTRLSVTRTDHGFESRVELAPLTSQVRLGTGTIQSTLFAATEDARLPDSVGTQLAEIFSSEIDFRRDLRRGDSFTVLYEALEADGEPIAWGQAAGRVLVAQFTNDAKTYEAAWFQEPGGKGAYFDLDGRSTRRAFLSSPVEFSRVTSGFAMRMHPVLQTWRRHLGVDLAAPTGTPVRTVGEGTVEFAGVQNGYGNVVFVKHSGERETVYAHLSRIGVHQGQRVGQGDLIGAVGATGWATGPHLHFEFRKGGEQLDPLQAARSSEGYTLSAAARTQFQAQALVWRSQLAAASGRQQFASAE